MSAVLLDDDFSTDTSANYTAILNGIAISGGTLRGTVADDLNVFTPLQVNPDFANSLGPCDCSFAATIKTLTGTDSSIGLYVRDQGGGANAVYPLWNADGTLELHQVIGGVDSTLASTNVPFSSNAKLEIRPIGTVAKVYISGVEQLSQTVSIVQFGMMTVVMFPAGSASNIEIERLEASTETPYLVLVGTPQEGVGNITPAWASGHVANDIGILDIESRGEQAASLGTAAGFAAVADSPQNTGTTTSGTRLTRYWCRASGSSQSSPTVTDPGDHAYGLITVYRGCITSGDPWDVTAGGVKASASTSFSAPGDTTTGTNRLIVVGVTRQNDASGAGFSAVANSDLYGVAEAFDGGTTQGDGGGIGIFVGIKAASGAFGNTTGTVSSSVNAYHTMALAPPSSGTAISAGFDALVITERTAAKALSRNVVGALDALAITERTATVKVSRAVAASLDALTIAEQAAVLRLSRSVVGAVDALVLTENQATVSVDTAIDIAAGLDALLIAEQAASAKLSRNVVAGLDALAITEQAAVIRLAKAIAAQVDALLIAEHGAAISSGLSLAAAVDNLLITERTAAVNARRQVAATTDALLVSEQAAEVRLAKLVSAGVDALLISEQQAVKTLSKAIAAGVDQLLITEGQADVDGIAAVISVVAQRVVYPQRDGMVDIAGRGQVAIGPRNSRITVH